MIPGGLRSRDQEQVGVECQDADEPTTIEVPETLSWLSDGPPERVRDQSRSEAEEDRGSLAVQARRRR